MKKLLTILLLIAGCGIFEEEGICLIRNMETNSHHCYPDWTENVCIENVCPKNDIFFKLTCMHQHNRVSWRGKF